MPPENYSDATLVLLGHGSTKNEDSATPVYQHAAELRRRRIFSEVREAFWIQEPNAVEVLKSLTTPRAFIVPFFISGGYFSEEVIPRALGFMLMQDSASRVVQHPSSTWHYCLPVGTHDHMTSVLLARARGVVSQFPFPHRPRAKDITLFIAGHGTERNDNSRKAIEQQVDFLRSLGGYAAVHGLFMEEAPGIRECYSLAQTRNIVVVPFFISDGMHTREDIPVLLGEPPRLVQERLASRQPTWRNPTERNGKLVWYAPAVGTELLMAEVILDRVRELSVK